MLQNLPSESYTEPHTTSHLQDGLAPSKPSYSFPQHPHVLSTSNQCRKNWKQVMVLCFSQSCNWDDSDAACSLVCPEACVQRNHRMCSSAWWMFDLFSLFFFPPSFLFFLSPKDRDCQEQTAGPNAQNCARCYHTLSSYSLTFYRIASTNTASKKTHYDCRYLISAAQISFKHFVFFACACFALLGFPPEASILKASVQRTETLLSGYMLLHFVFKQERRQWWKDLVSNYK